MKPTDYNPSMGESHPSNDDTLWSYRFPCKIHISRGSTKQGMLGNKSEFNVVCLIPEMCDQTFKFFGAWLPDMSRDENGNVLGHEVGIILRDPPYGKFRGRVQRRGPFCNEPHIFVMAVGMEEELLDICKRSKTEPRINVESMPANLEEQLDTMKDSNKSYDIIDPGIK